MLLPSGPVRDGSSQSLVCERRMKERHAPEGRDLDRPSVGALVRKRKRKERALQSNVSSSNRSVVLSAEATDALQDDDHEENLRESGSAFGLLGHEEKKDRNILR